MGGIGGFPGIDGMGGMAGKPFPIDQGPGNYGQSVFPSIQPPGPQIGHFGGLGLPPAFGGLYGQFGQSGFVKK